MLLDLQLTCLLRLQQFADSALPIGGVAHSFGLESLIDEGFLNPANLEGFFAGYLEETGRLEASCCIRSCRLARCEPDHAALAAWMPLNVELGARKLARESRQGSAALGRRFLRLAAIVSEIPLLVLASDQAGPEVHLAAAFGFVAGAMDLEPETAAAAYLQQSMTTLLSCCQRLMALGQTQAHQILWNLKPAIIAAATTARVDCFTPLPDIASARHPTLATRLFMS